MIEKLSLHIVVPGRTITDSREGHGLAGASLEKGHKDGGGSGDLECSRVG